MVTNFFEKLKVESGFLKSGPPFLKRTPQKVEKSKSGKSQKKSFLGVREFHFRVHMSGRGKGLGGGWHF